ncbi:MAG: monovalent cation/H+ antiporter complex subunit F [Deltaproteobacteria bacterium]|nr:monovalent cation/H+ antiporter complex subunit F [Deltaproteobacteria bacterium]
MDTVLHGAALILAALLFLPLYRVVRGPTAFDRALGAGTLGTKTIVLLVLMGFLSDQADMYIDISLGYGLALIIGTLVTAKYLESSVWQGGHNPEREP